MAFKSKITVDQLKDLTEVSYIKLAQQEVKRAAKFGETGVVVLSDYQFACGAVSTLLILGKMSGPLMKFYKQMKTERSKEKDFAKGTCYFENTDGDQPTMRIALDDGKGKPARIKKNGKKLLKKLGLAVEIFKGEMNLANETLAQEELDTIEAEVDKENDDQKMALIIKAYKKAFASVVADVVPLLKAKAGVEEQHYQLALKLLRLSKSIQDKQEEISEKQQAKYVDLVAEVKSREPKVIKIVANLKKMLANSTLVGNFKELHEEMSEQTAKRPLSEERRMQIKERLEALRERLKAVSA